MTAFPALEAALDAAAHRHYGRRRRRSWLRWVAAPALALGVAALMVAVLPAREGAPAGAPRVTVPPETLARSAALVAAPSVVPSGQDDDRVLVPHAQLPAVAAEIAAGVPYPPGAGESMDWEAVPADPRNMRSINFRSDIQMLVEYRAACTWVALSLHAFSSANTPALGAATTVLADIPRWPTFRGQPADDAQVFWNAIAAAATAREPGPRQREFDINCESVPSPWG